MTLSMKTFAAATALATAAFSASAANAAIFTIDFDVTGITSNAEWFSPDNEIFYLDLAPGAHIIAMDYDVNLTAFSPSWLSEMQVVYTDSAITAGVVTSPGYLDSTSGTASYAGSSDLVDLGLDFFVGDDGILRLEFGEGFDDSSVDPDGIWNFGTLTFTYEADDTPTPGVPEPTTWAMMIGGLGLAGTFLRRSRKVTQVSFS